MKFLLVFTMLMGSAFANVNNEWEIKCFEKEHHDLELAYKIKVSHDDISFDRELELEDCTRRNGGNGGTGGGFSDPYCRERGELRKVERQEETCLVLKRHDGMNNDSFSLCHEEQDHHDTDRRLVPVTVTDDNQEARIWCEKSILKIL